MRNTSFAAVILSLAACGDKPVFASAYLGTTIEAGHVMINSGAGYVRWDTPNRPHGAVRATVTAASDGRFRFALAGCALEVELQGNSGQVVASPPAVCEVDIDHFRGSLVVVGQVEVTRDTGAVKVSLFANNNTISPHVEWSLNYDARPE